MTADGLQFLSCYAEFLMLDLSNFLALDPKSVQKVYRYFEASGLLDAVTDFLLCATSKVHLLTPCKADLYLPLSDRPSLAKQD